MSGGAVFWMFIFGLSTLLFLIIAAFVAVQGWRDLKELLYGAEPASRRTTRP